MRFPTENEDINSLVDKVAEFNKSLKIRNDEHAFVQNKSPELLKEFTAEIAAFVKGSNSDGKLPVRFESRGDSGGAVFYYAWELWYEFVDNLVILKLIQNVNRETVHRQEEIFIGRRCDIKPDASGWQRSDIVWVKDFNDADKPDTKELARRSLYWLIKSQTVD
jgi:hypothetical protein